MSFSEGEIDDYCQWLDHAVFIAADVQEAEFVLLPPPPRHSGLRVSERIISQTALDVRGRSTNTQNAACALRPE